MSRRPGQGMRVDGFGYAGYRTSARYNSLLAKLIVHSPSESAGRRRAQGYRALCEFRIDGAATNIPFLQNAPAQPARWRPARSTRASSRSTLPNCCAEAGAPSAALFRSRPSAAPRAGVKVDAIDPLAVLAHGKRRRRRRRAARSGRPVEGPDGATRAERAVAGHDHQPRRPGRRRRCAPASPCSSWKR